MSEFDFIIAGAGIVGQTLAREIHARQPSTRILILEKESSVGQHASGRNSGVLHAGIYYPPGTFKAQICVTGAQLMRDYCSEHHLAQNKCGKIIVPTATKSEPAIDRLAGYARENGVSVQIIDGQQLREHEPHLHPDIQVGLYSPNTVVVNPKEIMAHIYGDLQSKSVIDFRFNCPVTNISVSKKTIHTTDGAFRYKHFINCAGSYADKLAKKFGIAQDVSLLPFRGRYFQLRGELAAKIKMNIYPVPDLNMPFLGVHFTPGVDGSMYVGPTAMPALGRENYTGLKNVDWLDLPNIGTTLARQYASNKQGMRNLVHNELKRLIKVNFLAEAQAMIPQVQADDLVPCQKVGIRAQLFDYQKRELVMDFCLESAEHSTHVLNSVSPAFTSSMAFAKHICDTNLSELL